MRECVEGKTLLSHADSMFSLLDEFFKLTMEEKQQYDLSKKGSYFGYKGKGKEVMDDRGNVDHNEMYNISKDDILAISDPLPAPFIIVSNRPLLQSYMQSNHLVLTTLFSSLSTSLGLPLDTFSNLHRFDIPSGCHTRFIQVHPYPDLLQQTLGEHTDFGSLSILFNRLGGLQVQLPDSHNWVYVRPVAGSAIVNLGDAMVKFSAGILRSNLHRVVSPPGEQAGMMRHSLVYFCRPEHEAILKRVKGGLVDAEGRDNGEEGVSSREWLERRHLARKIGVGAVGFQQPGDLAKGKGTEGNRTAWMAKMA
ncbi:MAG: hypothetical protein Q9214_007093 [Letrouitia sp. 1 TL-2023]